MFDNTLVLAGVLSKAPQRTVSPSGIPHCQFVLEHRSQQIEANMPRQAWCRIKVVASGEELKQQTDYLQLGSQIRVSGFISRVESRNGVSQLVLHAQQIDRID
ncbi:primosomal replication protein N [Catenovulum sp. SM1970]|uniref:primosomal replication protein N n=1 Tax=Marinifaba aquimaris TaxID=2741323 RepID=UPI0015717F56|nr:primosomal replication protein N [Marinifaba aquimaris]